uniref:Uncharacterized protein n=1 Tax=Caulobacter sp. (strain K31) TaxID=366602 RepID=B0T903_CAUSK
MAPNDDVPAGPPLDEGALAPHRQIQKFLISTTTRLSGDYAARGLIVREAYPGLRQRATHQQRVGPAGRTVLTLSFRMPAEDHDSIIIPDYDHVADMVCAYLAVLYGKRFDNHGAIESSGFFRIPDLAPLDVFADRQLPTNSDQSRADFPVSLSLGEMGRLSSLMFGEAGRSSQASVFRGAARFYLRALKAAEADIEVAYLHLITAGEILSNASEVDADHLLDAQTRQALDKIERGLPEGPKIARMVRGKLRSIRRRFIWTFTHWTDPPFFERGEAVHPFQRLRANGFLKTVSAAYDLRSRYVHTGKAFGDIVAPRGARLSEVQSGRPIVDDPAFGKILAEAPTFTGLERLVRYGLLRFAQASLDADLDVSSPAGREADDREPDGPEPHGPATP